MTTIVASKKHRQMAADRKATDTGASMRYSARKLRRIGQSIVGCAGDSSTIAQFVRWLEAGGDHADKPKFSKDGVLVALVLNAKGLFIFDTDCEPDEIEQDFYAIGTGAQAGMAAMHLGADPKKAVTIAAKVDVMTEGPFDVLTLG